MNKITVTTSPYDPILQILDLEIAVAGARQFPVEAIVLNEADYKRFCTAIDYKDSILKDWPVYKGVKIIKGKSNARSKNDY